MGRKYSKPSESFKPVRFGNNNKAINNEILGFCNRDQMISSHISTPYVVSPLGRDFMKQANEIGDIPAEAREAWQTRTTYGGSTKNSQHESVPGLSTIWFVPMLNDQSDEFVSFTKEAYSCKWREAHVVNNNVKNWQPGDLHAVDAGLSLLVMMCHVARRALAVMRDVVGDGNNVYYNKVALLKAMGFTFTEDEVSRYYNSLWQVFNQAIVSKLDVNQWLSYSFPGAKRWARLCDNIYRDTPIKTTYAQYFIYMPKYVPTFGETQLSDGTRSYIIDFVRNENGNPVHWATRYSPTTIQIGERGYQGFMTFLNDISRMINSIFINDSTSDIIATLAAVERRGYTTDLTKSELLDVDRLDYQDLSSDHLAPEQYDETLNIALANATIATYLRPTAATINSLTGNLEQYLKVDSGPSGAGYTNATKLGLLNLMNPKVINFPSVLPTTSDFMSMTQWTISLSRVTIDIRGWAPEDEQYAPSPYFPAFATGSDFVGGVTIWNRDTTGAYYTQPTDPRCYIGIEYSGSVVDVVDMDALAQYNSQFSDDCMRAVDNSLAAFELAQQFAFMPQANRYRFIRETVPGSDTPILDAEWMGPIVQSDVYYLADGKTLSQIHSQWKANFWGYPVYRFGDGVAQFSTATGASTGAVEQRVHPTLPNTGSLGESVDSK